MKIATFNVNGVNGRLPRLLEWLAETNPDVVCLQEIKTEDARCPRAALENAGYGSIWHGQRAHHGVAILGKGQTPQEKRRRLPGDDADRESRYLEAQINGIAIASIYLPNGNPQPGPRFDYKLSWFERLIEYARGFRQSGPPVVLAGDFNVVPTNADIYNVWAWRDDAVVQPQSRAAYARLLEQGWVDATRHFYPRERIYTYWVSTQYYRRNAGFRMDFLLANRALLSRLESAGVDTEYRGRERPSDHAPVWLKLRE